jgi:peroxiredoxin Q/BCP
MENRLSPGDKAPDFTLPSTRGEQSLAQHRGAWVVLYFYPKDNTPGCTQEACDFRDLLPGMNATVLGVSPDDVASHDRFTADYDLPFPLIADTDHALAEAYGAWGEKNTYGKTYQGVIRSTFIIDPEGHIADAMYNVKATDHAQRVGERLQELQTA